MSTDILTRAVAAFSALTLASLLTTSAAIAASGVGFGRPNHGAGPVPRHQARAVDAERLGQGGCVTGSCAAAAIQAKPAHIAKVNANIALRAAGASLGGRR